MNIMDYQKEVRKMDKDEDINQLTDLLIDNEIDERTIEIALSIICHRFSFTYNRNCFVYYMSSFLIYKRSCI